MSQEVLAVVGGEEITETEFHAFLQGVPREQQAYISNPQFRQQCLDQLISLRLFAKMGEELALDQTGEYKKIMTNARKDILAQLAMAEAMKDIAVTEEDVQAYYDANTQQFSKGPLVHAKHILTDTEEKCSAIMEEITSEKKTFEESAKEASSCPSGAKGGDLGEFGRGQMVKEFEDAAFEAEIGHVVGPVKTQFGYHLIKVEGKTEASVATLEEVSETIKKQLYQQRQGQIFQEKTAELRKKYMQE